MPKTCQGMKRDGTACRVPALPDSDHCWAHAPHLVDERHRVRSLGGRGRSNAARAAKRMSPDLTGLIATLHDTVEGVRDGTVTPAQGSAIGSLAKAIVAVHESAVVDAELTALRAEVDRLREKSA